MGPHKLRVHSRSTHFSQNLTSRCIVTDHADWPYRKIRWSPAGAHKPRNVMKDDVQLAVIPRVKQFAQPAFVAAQFVFALERIDHARSDAADADSTRKSAFRVCAQSQHKFRTTPNLDFR